MRPKFPIALKLMLLVAGAALLPMAFMTTIAFQSLAASHEVREQERRKEVLIGVKKEIELIVKNTEWQVESIASHFDVRKDLSIELDSPYFSQNEFIQNAGSLLGASGFDFLDFIDENGLFRARGQAPDDFNRQSGEIELLNSMKTASDGSVRISWRDTIDERQIPSLEATSPVVDSDTEVVGMVLGGHNLDEDFFNRLGRPGGEGGVILADGNLNGLGSTLPASEEVLFFDYISEITSDDLAFPLANDAPDWEKANFEGNILAAVSLNEWFDEDSPVILIVTFPQDEFQSYLSDLTHSLVVYSGLAAVLALVVGLILASGISAPIRLLSARALEFAQTGTFKPFNVRSSDEIEALVKSFKQMADELEANTRRLIQAEKLAAWRDVARKLAHEIKNPLFPIKLNVENMQRFYGKDEKAFDETFKEATGTIMEEVEHLKRLADEFSSFARMPKPLLESRDINGFVGKIMEMFPSNDKIKYETELGDNLPVVMFDDGQFKMVLVNLIKNAAESFDGNDGIVSVSTHSIPEESQVLIQISDNGHGLSESDLEKVFTPYYTTKESGTGLGLAIVENIINDHAGKIWAQSQPGEGTTFFITLNVVE